MVGVVTTAALVGLLVAQNAPPPAQFDLSGQWKLASATTNASRNGGDGEQPTKTYLFEWSAFNCGRGCRITQKGTTLTIESAQLKDGDSPSSPPVAIIVDGAPHMVTDSLNAGNTIETTGHWQGGKLVIVSMLLGVPTSQTISLEQNQLVVVKSSATSNLKLTFRYTKQ